MAGRRSASAATSTGHSSMSTRRFESRSLKPSTMRSPARSAVRTARRRLAGSTPIVSATSASTPSRASAATTKSRLKLARRGERHHLQRAAAAGAEMPADGRDTIRARLEDVDQPAALAVALDRDAFAGQREGHVDRTRPATRRFRRRDGRAFDRDDLSHDARRAGIPGCRRRRRRARGAVRRTLQRLRRLGSPSEPRGDVVGGLPRDVRLAHDAALAEQSRARPRIAA